MYSPTEGGGVPLSQNPYARRQLGLSPQLDPRVVAMLVKAGVHVAGVNDNPGGGMIPRQRTARAVGAPHLRTAHPVAPIDLAAIGGGLTAIPGPALEEGLRTAQGPVAPPGMPPAAPQPVGGPTFGQGMDELHAGQVQRLGQLGRYNAIAAQLVKRLMLHRMVGRLAQPAAQGAGVPVMPGTSAAGGHVAY